MEGAVKNSPAVLTRLWVLASLQDPQASRTSLDNLALTLLSGGSILLVLGLGWLLWQFRGVLSLRMKTKKALPKHLLAFTKVDPEWTEEKYVRHIEGLYKEVQAAVEAGDQETLEVLCQGRALATFQSSVSVDPVANLEKKDFLAGSAIQSWDPDKKKLVVLFIVARWVKRWRTYREEWTLQKRGKGWFLVDRTRPNTPK